MNDTADALLITLTMVESLLTDKAFCLTYKEQEGYSASSSLCADGKASSLSEAHDAN